MIHRSDREPIHISAAFRTRCEQAGIEVSMGRRGDAYDNAVAGSFFASLETELLDRDSFAHRNQARSAVFDYIRRLLIQPSIHALPPASPVDKILVTAKTRWFRKRDCRADQLLPRPALGYKGVRTDGY